MLPASRGGSLLPGAPTGGQRGPGAAPAPAAAARGVLAIGAVKKGAGLVFDAFDRAGVATLGLREVVAGELPELWAAAAAAAGAGIPIERVAVIRGVVVHGPVAGADGPLYWDREHRRFTSVPVRLGRCGEVRGYSGLRHPISDHFDAAFEGQGAAVDATANADFAMVNGRRVRTRINADVRAFTFTLPLALFQRAGDTITLFAPAGTPAGNTTTITSAGAPEIRNMAGELVDSLLLVPNADEDRHITFRVDNGGLYWRQDQGSGLNAVVLASATRLAHTEAADEVRAAGQADHQRVPTEQAVREALALVGGGMPAAPETLYDGFADGVAALTVASNSRAWDNTERVAFTRALVAADDGRDVEIAGEYTLGGGGKKYFRTAIPAWLFRRMAATAGAVATAAETLDLYVQRPAGTAPSLTGWSEAVMHIARWRSNGNDGVWFNVGSANNLSNLTNFRCRVMLR